MLESGFPKSTLEVCPNAFSISSLGSEGGSCWDFSVPANCPPAIMSAMQGSTFLRESVSHMSQMSFAFSFSYSSFERELLPIMRLLLLRLKENMQSEQSSMLAL